MQRKTVLLKLLLLLESILLVGMLCYIGYLHSDNKSEIQSDFTPILSPAISQEKRYIEEELFQIAKEGLIKYRTMLGEYFMTFLQTKGSLTQEDQVTINGVDNYFLVTDERYPNLQSVKNHIETICTKEYAELLYREEWDLGGERPFLAELNGKLYTQVADAPFGMGNLYIPLVCVNDKGDIVFFFKCIHEEDSEYEWVEEGVMTLEEQNDIWYVKSVQEFKK